MIAIDDGPLSLEVAEKVKELCSSDGGGSAIFTHYNGLCFIDTVLDPSLLPLIGTFMP